jgi:hypothetical protein
MEIYMATEKAAVTPIKKVRKAPTGPRNALSLSDKLRLATLIKDGYTESSLSDGEFAKVASQSLGLTISAIQVASIREALGIPKVPGMTIAQARERIRELEALLGLR